MSVTRADRRVAGAWAASHLALMGVMVVGSLLLGVATTLRHADAARWLVERVTWWDSWHYVRIAEVGYLPPGLPCCDQAFFPGYPLLMRWLAPLLGGSVIVAGLIITLAAGSVAAVLVRRLSELQHPGSGRYAVLLLAVAPTGVFFVSVYTEALFLALALGAWLAASRRHWWLAGGLAAGTTGVRVNGLFLVAGLAVMYVGQLAHERRRPRPDVLALALPALPVLAYFGYLAWRTGSVNAWQDAQSAGWVREVAWPWQGFAAGWQAATSAHAPDLVVSRWADLLAVLLGVVATVVLLRLRRWAEATYLGLSVGVLVCSTMLTSAPRYALTWFPLYLLGARLLSRPRWAWVRVAVPGVCVPALLAWSLAFSAHLWVA